MRRVTQPSSRAWQSPPARAWQRLPPRPPSMRSEQLDRCQHRRAFGAAEMARQQCGVDVMEAVATALEAPRPARQGLPKSHPRLTGKKQKVELTPRENTAAADRYGAAAGRVLDARGRRRGVFEHVGAPERLITGDLSTQVSNGPSAISRPSHQPQMTR